MSVAERGTPKTLKEAIQNGVDEFDEQPFEEGEEIRKEDLVTVVQAHVTDFLAQKLFAAAMKAELKPEGFKEKEMHLLYKRITQ